MTLQTFKLMTKVCERNGWSLPRPKDIPQARWDAMKKQYAQIVSMAGDTE